MFKPLINMIKVAFTDDHPIVIDGLRTALQQYSEIIITGAYYNGAESFMALKEQQPDVLLLDLQLPDKSGRELVPLILQQYPNLHILILSGIESSPNIKEMIQKGCKGYLLKSTTNQSILVTAIKQVYAGELFLDSRIKEQLLQEMLVSRRNTNKLNPNYPQGERGTESYCKGAQQSGNSRAVIYQSAYCRYPSI